MAKKKRTNNNNNEKEQKCNKINSMTFSCYGHTTFPSRRSIAAFIQCVCARLIGCMFVLRMHSIAMLCGNSICVDIKYNAYGWLPNNISLHAFLGKRRRECCHVGNDNERARKIRSHLAH